MTGRPHNSEAAPYYFTYIDQIDGEDALAAIESQLDEAGTLFQTISEEQSFHRYAAGKWSIRQVVNHVTDTERVLAFRAFWFARGFATALPSFDQDTAVLGAQADLVPISLHAQEFRHVRRSTIALFQTMPPEGWTRGGIASDNFFSVRALAWLIAGHLAHHLALLRERYL